MRLAALALGLAACTPEPSLVLDLGYASAEGTLGCEALGIESIELEVEGALSRTVPCAPGVLELGLTGGPYTVRARAYGPLGGARTLLYAGLAELVPAGPRSLVLEPEVVALSVAWRFEGEDPCAEGAAVELHARGAEVQRLDLGCAPPAHVHLTPGRYALAIEARSAAGGLLFSDRHEGELARGVARLDARLVPAGGRITLGWRFEVEGRATGGCGGAETISARIAVAAGDTFEETIPCAAEVPYALRAARFPENSRVQLELVAEGEHRFRHGESVLMPAGDRALGVVPLVAVGSATVRWSLSPTSACHGQAIEQWDVIMGDQVNPVPIFSSAYPPEVREARVEDRPYGYYAVVVSGRRYGAAVCLARGWRTLGARESAWEPLAP